MTERACPKCGTALPLPGETTLKLVKVDCAHCGAVVVVRLSDPAAPPPPPTALSAEGMPSPQSTRPRFATQSGPVATRAEERRGMGWAWALLLLAVVVIGALILMERFT